MRAHCVMGVSNCMNREKRTEKCIVDLLGSNSTLKYFNLFGPTTSKKIKKHMFYDEILDLQDFQGGQEDLYHFLSFLSRFLTAILK